MRKKNEQYSVDEAHNVHASTRYELSHATDKSKRNNVNNVYKPACATKENQSHIRLHRNST